ncbi:hypothetical protein CDD82_7761 [Ophiocordyceps australis]|uniref:Carrier domain-containing protein n=1 Tax=Ophiocordyceps australis TaxID=1399860 RepID=A0A2C5ZLA1_9HYPO|nr:hypothetical protein CDD82_7761 [Ophiocordyceps australis]
MSQALGSQRLLTEIIDHLSETEPDATWLEYPKSTSDYAAGFNAITYRALANAVNGLAWHLHRNVEKTSEFQTIAYIGQNDARYALMLYACIKAGFKVFFTSPKNSVSTHLGLFSTLQCSILVTTRPTPAIVEDISSAHSMQVVFIPSLEELLEKHYETFPCNKTFADARSEPFLVLHTSGSTSSPKALVYTHEFVSRNISALQLSTPMEFFSVYQLYLGSRYISLFPLFHMAGYWLACVATLFSRATVILPSPSSPPTGDTLYAMLHHTTANWAAVSPVTVDSIGRNPEALQFISENLERLIFAGGNPSVAMGNKVSSKIKICNLYGSSECGGCAHLIPNDNADEHSERLWSYISIQSQTNPVFEEHTPGLYELVIKRDPLCEAYQPVFEQRPELQEFRTSDLFAPHPKVPGFWQHRGRIDDTIVFLSGEKTNPLSFESFVLDHPDVSGALVFGTNRMEAGILIELADTEQSQLLLHDKKEAIDNLWPRIDMANSSAPVYARIAESHVCFVSPKKPMLRSGKGTIRRQDTIRLYAEEIEEIYKESELLNGQSESRSIDINNIDEIAQAIRSAFAIVTKRDIPDDADFFSIGMDSVQVIRLVRQLRRVTGLADITPALVYKNPSISTLSLEIAKSASSNAKENSSVTGVERLQVLEQTIQEYKGKIAELMQATKNSHAQSSQQQSTILVTGTTGYIGSYILNSLLAHPSSPKIICLNRSADSVHVQASRNKLRDESLATHFPADRVKFLSSTDTSNAQLGLSDLEYQHLLRQVTLVIHNAWPVDFNLPLSAFRASLDGLVGIIELCKTGNYSPSLIFVSSISVAMNLQAQYISEAIIDNLEAPTPGYGESKFVAEHMLFEASRKLNFKASVVRVGQVSGAAYSPGRWNRRDWLPRMVLSSRYIGAIPKHLGVLNKIEWIPIDVLSKFVIEISTKLGFDSSFEVYHAINPHVTTWQKLLPTVIQALDTESPATEKSTMDCISPTEWVERLRQSSVDFASDKDDEQIDTRNPALKLLDFFDETFQIEASEKVDWSTEVSVKMSETLRRSECIQPEWMERWVRGLL